MSRPYSKNKTFKPIILYDSSRSLSPTSATTDDKSPSQKALVDEHRAKIKSMLDYNAQLWESEGRFYDTSSSSKIVSSDQTSPPQEITLSDDQHSIRGHSNRSSMSFIEPFNTQMDTSNDDRRESLRSPKLKSPSRANVLEPQTQNSIPLPLYNHELLIRAPTEMHMTRFNSMLSPGNQGLPYATNLEEEDDGEDYDTYEEPVTNEHGQTTTFINEPQFHHTYKPHIARKRRRGNLPKEVTEFLKRWLILHKKHPYPTESEKQKLADETGLMVNQISNWFINARRRILQPLLELESRQSKTTEKGSNNFSSSTHTGVNVVGGSDGTIRDSNNPLRSIDAAESSNSNSSNYHPHHHHNYNSNSNINKNNLLLQQPSIEDITNPNTEKDIQNNMPPPWVLLPAKLPSMNILEKDLEAFEPEK